MEVVTDQAEVTFDLPHRLATAPSVAENGHIVAETLQAIAGNQPQQSGLARTVFPCDQSVLQRRDVQRDVIQHPPAAILHHAVV